MGCDQRTAPLPALRATTRAPPEAFQYRSTLPTVTKTSPFAISGYDTAPPSRICQSRRSGGVSGSFGWAPVCAGSIISAVAASGDPGRLEGGAGGLKRPLVCGLGDD